MDNSALMSEMHRPCHGGDEPDGIANFSGFPQWQRLSGSTFLQPLGETLAGNEFHAEVVPTVALSDFVNWDDAGMVEIGRRLGFQFEPRHVIGSGQLAGKNHLDGDRTIQARLPAR